MVLLSAKRASNMKEAYIFLAWVRNKGKLNEGILLTSETTVCSFPVRETLTGEPRWPVAIDCSI